MTFPDFGDLSNASCKKQVRPTVQNVAVLQNRFRQDTCLAKTCVKTHCGAHLCNPSKDSSNYMALVKQGKAIFRKTPVKDISHNSVKLVVETLTRAQLFSLSRSMAQKLSGSLEVLCFYWW
jgi:hypothetical protein